MIRNTVLLVIGWLILGGLGFLITLDYYWWLTKQATISSRTHQFLAEHANQPALFLVIGVLIGFGLGLVLGVILGHLFWP